MSHVSAMSLASNVGGATPDQRAQGPEVPTGRRSAGKPDRPASARRRLLFVAAVVVGLLLRLTLALIAPRYAFVGDHVANLLWGMAAEDRGIVQVYNLKTADLPVATGTMVDATGVQITRTIPAGAIGLPNHPPLAIALYEIQAKLLRAILPSATLNTATTRLLVAGTQMPFDIALAVAIGLLAAIVGGAPTGRDAAALAWLFPPFALNSSFWGQVDTVLLVPAVLAIVLILRNRWVAGGVVWGLGLLFKPQAILIAPVVVFAAFMSPGQRARPALRAALSRLASFGTAGIGVAFLVSLPWTVRGGAAWFERCYVDNITHAYPLTTLKAFNVWYLDALRLDGAVRPVLDSHQRVLGVSKDAWGHGFLLVSLVGAALLAWRRYARSREGVVVFAALWLWSAFIWPTRVHERYILYATPFVLALAACHRRWVPVALALVVVGSAEQTWLTWMRGVPAASLVSEDAVADRYFKDEAAYGQLGANSQKAPRPTLQAAESEVNREAAPRRAQYVLQRRAVWPIELTITVLSLAAYVAAWWLAFGPRAMPSTA